jgi:hypothetical protein
MWGWLNVRLAESRIVWTFWRSDKCSALTGIRSSDLSARIPVTTVTTMSGCLSACCSLRLCSSLRARECQRRSSDRLRVGNLSRSPTSRCTLNGKVKVHSSLCLIKRHTMRALTSRVVNLCFASLPSRISPREGIPDIFWLSGPECRWGYFRTQKYRLLPKSDPDNSIATSVFGSLHSLSYPDCI